MLYLIVNDSKCHCNARMTPIDLRYNMAYDASRLTSSITHLSYEQKERDLLKTYPGRGGRGKNQT